MAKKRKTHSSSSFAEIASQYARDVIGGEIPACKWVQLACRRHLADLKRKRFPWRFDAERADKVCTFISRLPHVKGKWASRHEPMRLEPWQVFGIASIFGWVHTKTGLRRFREVYWTVPRKNGKSQMAAGIGLWMLGRDDEYGAEVYSGATSEKQAWEVFRPARLMVARTPQLREGLGIEVNAATLVRVDDMARFEPVIGKPGDGASPSCAIVDEYHEHDSPELYDTMMTGMGAREQPLMLIITTAGVNTAGPCYDKQLYAQKVLAGQLEDETLFAAIYTIDEDDDWTTTDALIKANPNYGVSVSDEYLAGRQRIAMQSAAQQNVFKTKHLNVWCGARAAWMNMQAWSQAPRRLALSELAGRRCFIGLDLATKVDVAAMALLFPPDDGQTWHLHLRFYLPEDVVEERAAANFSHYATWARQGFMQLTPGNVIDFEYIQDDLRDMLSRYSVAEVGYDPWQATQLATQMLGEGAPMVELRQTVQNMSEPMKHMEALVLSRKLAHGDDPVMTWMMGNVVAKLDAKDNIYPRKERPENKIDGPVAAIMALARAMASTSPDFTGAIRTLDR